MIRSIATAGAAAFALLFSLPAAADPGLEAIEQFRTEKRPTAAIENRFFLKEGRFEASPQLGYVPNNPFARRYVGGLGLGYHINEVFSLQGSFTYSPDMGESDLKGLVAVLLDRAANASTSSTASFQQPLDKVVISAGFNVAWAPVYGKINLVGEKVLNFDLYGVAGLGIISKTNYVAVYDDKADPNSSDIVTLNELGNESNIAPILGIGQNYFLNQIMSFKIDVRSMFYVDDKPQYDPNVPVTEQRLYNNFVASVGIAVFVPGMKPRLYDF